MTSIEKLTENIRAIYESSPKTAQSLIEDYLDAELKHLPYNQKISAVQDLDAGLQGISKGMHLEKEIIDRLIDLLLGKNVRREDLASAEILDRLAESLNTIFDMVNQLIGVINSTLAADKVGEETIRHVIGINLDSKSSTQPLEKHLGQIKKAFLTTQQAFKNAASTTMEKIIDELDPKKISSQPGSSLKFGPLKKAESFDIYEEKFMKFRKWYESGRFMEDFLREFEKYCQEISIS
jgi:hypothetical protein